MLEFQKATEEIEEHLAISRKGYGEGWSGFRAAEESYNKAVQIREQILQNTLKEMGLAVCSGHHFFLGTAESEEWRTKSAEQLGIYPRDQMKLRYVQGMVSDTEHFTMVTCEWVVTEVLLLCPEHFPQKYIDLYGKADVPKIYSEVVQKDGKYIVMKNGIDITKLINKGRTPRSKIELDGNTHPGLAVYRYLGIPDLPEKPDLNKVKQST